MSVDLVLLKAELLEVRYYIGGKCGKMPLRHCPDLSYEQGAQILAQQSDPVLRGVGVWAVGHPLMYNESASLPDGRTLSKKELCFEALKIDSTLSFAYSDIGHVIYRTELDKPTSAGSEKPVRPLTTLPDGRIFSEQDLYLEAMRHQNPAHVIFFNNLALCMPSDQEKVTLPDGRIMTNNELFLEGIRMDSSYSFAFYNLANSLGVGGSIQLFDGRHLGYKDLLCETLRCDPLFGNAFHCLGRYLALQTQADGDSEVPTLTLPDGRSLNQLQLLQEAAQLECTSAVEVCTDLAQSLPSTTSTVTFRDGSTWNFRSLAFKAYTLDPTKSHVYQVLRQVLVADHSGEDFSDDGTPLLLELPDGRLMSSRDLLQEAVRLDPSNSDNYYELATYFRRDDSATVTVNGVEMNCKQLCVECLRRDPSHACAYHEIAASMSDDETVLLADGRILNKQQICVETLRYGQHSFFFSNLASTLIGEEKVTLHDGRQMTKIELLVEAVKLNPSCPFILRELGLEMQDDEKVTLSDGRTLMRYQVLLEAVIVGDAINWSSPSVTRDGLADDVREHAPSSCPWSRRSHVVFFNTNVLFATLLLGLQRLETAKVLPPAHYSMLEDMLEGWTLRDDRDVPYNLSSSPTSTSGSGQGPEPEGAVDSDFDNDF